MPQGGPVLGQLAEAKRRALVGAPPAEGDPELTAQYVAQQQAKAPLAWLKQPFEAVTDTALGAIGLGPDTGANRLGALVGAVLPMTAAARAARAKELGFTTEAFHGTKNKWRWYDDPKLLEQFNAGTGQDYTGPVEDALRSFAPNRGGGLKMMDGMGTHVGTAEAANQRLVKNWGASQQQGSYVMPLQVRTQKPFVSASGEPYTETELQSRLSAIAKRLGFDVTRQYSARSLYRQGDFRKAQLAVKKYLQDQGYDSIPYVNSHEARGSVSWVIFEPEQLRSRFAAFDPAQAKSRYLLAGLGGAATAAGLGAGQGER